MPRVSSSPRRSRKILPKAAYDVFGDGEGLVAAGELGALW
jgi:hypothetical protein